MPMNYQVSSDNIDVSDSMRELVNSKLQRLEKRWVAIPEDSRSARVVLNSAPDGTFLVKIELNLDGDVYYTEEPGFELETALIDALDELDRQYRKRKDKYENKWPERREEKKLKEEDLEVPEEEIEIDTTYIE